MLGLELGLEPMHCSVKCRSFQHQAKHLPPGKCFKGWSSKLPVCCALWCPLSDRLLLVPFSRQDDSKVLEQPIVVQSVGTDGRVFQFLVLQLNTTDLASNEGVKNLVWMDSDQLLYQHFWCLPVIKKKVVVVSPAVAVCCWHRA